MQTVNDDISIAEDDTKSDTTSEEIYEELKRQYGDADIKDSDFEMRYTTKISELLYEISDHYTAGFQDFMDGIIQFKSIEKNIKENDHFDEQIVREALEKTPFSDLYHSFLECSGGNNNLIDYAQESTEDIYKNYNDFVDYALELEATVALVENEMASEMSEEQFKSIMEEINNSDSVNSIQSFLTDDRISSYVQRVLGRMAAKYGLSLANPGMTEVAKMMADKSAWALLSWETHAKVFKEGFHCLLRGDKLNPGILFHSETGANSGGVLAKLGSSRLTGGIVAAIFTFGIEMISSKTNDGVITGEEVAIGAARAVAAGSASIAASLVTDLLASTAVGSTYGGLIGAGVGIALSVVENLIIDKIVYDIHFEENGVPREYVPIDESDIEAILREKGLEPGTPKAYGYDNESIYDTISSTLARYDEEKLIYYFVQKKNGLNMLPEEEFKRYDYIMNMWKLTPQLISRGEEGKKPIIDAIYAEMPPLNDEQRQQDLDFIDSIFNLFTPKNMSEDEQLYQFYLNTIDDRR